MKRHRWTQPDNCNKQQEEVEAKEEKVERGVRGEAAVGE